MLKKSIFILSILALFLPTLTLADGMVIAPSDRYVYETGQKAVIFYENGVERLVLSTSFKGDAEDFAWIIPTPQKPEVNKSSDELFASLEKLTAPQIDYNRPQPLFLGAGSVLEEKSVQIIETKKIDYYNITVLTAGDKEALVKWLNDHEYQFPENSSYILDSYITDKWYFTAVKIDAVSLSSGVEQQLREGHAIPLQLVFKTDKPVYPLKISSVVNEDMLSAIKSSYPTFIDGIENKGFRLNFNEHLDYNNSQEIPLFQGSIEMWVQPKVNFLSGVASGMLMSASMLDKNKNEYSPNNSWNIRINNDGRIIFNHTMNRATRNWITDEQITIPWEKGKWSHLALVWELREFPTLYFNGKEISWSTRGSIQSNQLSGEEMIGPTRYSLGGEANTHTIAPDYYLRTFDFAIDELRISNIARTQSEIKDSFEKHKASLDTNTVFITHFDNNLKIEKNEQQQEEFNYSAEFKKEAVLPQYPTKPSNINISIYTFTPNKKQQVADFTTDYAGWVKRDEIKNLASLDNGQPWFFPTDSKYYLTRLSRNMNYNEMTYDLYLKDAQDNETVNYIETTEKSTIWFWIVISFAILLTLILLVVLIIHYRR